MAEAVFMPKQGQSVETCIITQWYKKKGDKVNEGDLLFAYETDKAAFDEEAKQSGTILEIFFDEGDEVPVLSNVAVIGDEGEDISSFAPEGEAKEKKEEELIKEEKSTSSEEEVSISDPDRAKPDQKRIKISPRARAMAEDKGFDIKNLEGSGPNGRIIVRDIEAFKKDSKTAATKPEIPETDYSAFEGEYPGTVEKPLSNIRKIIAQNMQASLQNSAQLTHHLSADARKILQTRKEIKTRLEKENIENISLNDMVCYAVVQTLRKHPGINSHFLGDKIREFQKIHLGMAVDTERGLMVPVLKNADDYNLSGLSSKLKTLAGDCRNGSIDPELLQAHEGSFTVSNLGAYGIEMFTPVLNIPQSGILGINTIKYEARETGGTISFIPVIGLSLTYDHRAIDGAPASAFLKDLAEFISLFPVEVNLG